MRAITRYDFANLFGYMATGASITADLPSMVFGIRDNISYTDPWLIGFWLVAELLSLTSLLLLPGALPSQIILAGWYLLSDTILFFEWVLIEGVLCCSGRGMFRLRYPKFVRAKERKDFEEARRENIEGRHLVYGDVDFEKAEIAALFISPTDLEREFAGTRWRWDLLWQIFLLASGHWIVVDYISGRASMDYPEQGATVASLDWKGRLAWGLGWASTAVFNFARVLSLFMRKVNKRRKRAKGARIVADPYGVNACLAVLFISLWIGNALGLAGILTISIEPSYILYQLPWILANAVPLLLDGLTIVLHLRAMHGDSKNGAANDGGRWFTHTPVKRRPVNQLLEDAWRSHQESIRVDSEPVKSEDSTGTVPYGPPLLHYEPVTKRERKERVAALLSSAGTLAPADPAILAEKTRRLISQDQEAQREEQILQRKLKKALKKARGRPEDGNLQDSVHSANINSRQTSQASVLSSSVNSQTLLLLGSEITQHWKEEYAAAKTPAIKSPSRSEKELSDTSSEDEKQ